MEYYTVVTIRLAFRHLHPSWRWLVMIVYIALSIFIYWTVFNYREIDKGDYPMWIKTVASPLMLGFVLAKVVILVLMLGGDIYRLFRWFINLGMKSSTDRVNAAIPRAQFLAQSALAVGGIIMTGFAYGVRNKYNYAIRKVKIPVDSLNAPLAGMKIVHISDIHAGSFDDADAVARGIDMIMQQGADMILFTGDIVNNTQDELIPYLQIFSKLRAPLGVYAVLGNHDYGDYVPWDSEAAQRENLAQLEGHFTTMGWQLLKNEHKILQYNQHDFALLGVENWSSRAGFPKYGKMSHTVKGLENKSSMYQILMSHDPSHWDSEIIHEYKNVNLTLSGHTHGMQFGIRLPHFQWSPVQYVYQRWNGLYKEGNQHLYINPGYGFIGYKGRVGILPEITVIEFVMESAHEN